MAVSVPSPDAASVFYPADLVAKTLIITAKPSTGLVYVAAVCENNGPGRANGPFSIGVAVDIDALGLHYFESFEVPADVSLAPPPRFEAEIALAPGLGSVWQTTYVTRAMEIPLHYRDQDGSVYNAEFLVDVDFDVSDPDRVNNYWSWPPPGFWFLSPEARQRKGVFVVERSLSAQAG
jgi:hypothetical protein